MQFPKKFGKEGRFIFEGSGTKPSLAEILELMIDQQNAILAAAKVEHPGGAFDTIDAIEKE